MPAHLPWPLVFQVLGVVAAVWLLANTWQIWLLAFTALVIAAAILPAARFAERRRVPRGITVLAVYVAGAGVLALVGRLLWPALSEQAQQFIEHLPRLVDNVKGWLGDLRFYIGQWGASLPTPKADNLQGVLAAVLGNTLSVTAGVFGGVVGVLAVLVIAAYVVIEAEHLGASLLVLVPPRHRPVVASLAEPVLDRIGGYVRGQIVSSLFVGALIAVGLSLLGVRYALLVGVLAAVLNFVPFLGATIAAVLGILSALNESVARALLAAAVLWGAQLVEGKFLAPHFVGRATGLHPLVVLLALLAGAHVAGLIGALVAVPFLAGLWEVARVLYVEPHGVEVSIERRRRPDGERAPKARGGDAEGGKISTG
jgi:predicted PurR-regulated permease PerM